MFVLLDPNVRYCRMWNSSNCFFIVQLFEPYNFNFLIEYIIHMYISYIEAWTGCERRKVLTALTL